MAPSLVTSAERESGQITGSSSGTLTLAAAIAAASLQAGDTVTVFFVSGSPNCLPTGPPPTVGGVTWTQRAALALASSCPIYSWTGVVPATPQAVNPAVPYRNSSTNSTAGHLIVVVTRGVALPATPNVVVSSAVATTTTTGGATLPVTQTTPGSMLLWVGADWNGVTSGTPTPANADTLAQSYLYSTAGVLADWGYYRASATAGKKTVGFSGFSTSATRAFTFVAIELPPPEPAWTPTTTSTGSTSWAADFTKSDVVAAGYQDDSNQRQNSDGSYVSSATDPVMPWPMKIETPAPWGSPAGAGAALCRVPDSVRRNELEPNVATWKNGEGWYVGLSFAVDPDMDRLTQGQQNGPYQTIWQLRPMNFTGSPPVSLEVGQGNAHLWATGGNARPGASPDYQYAWSRDTGLTIEPCTWYQLVLFVGVWPEVGTGRFCIWDARSDTLLLDLVPPCGTNWPKGSTGSQDDGTAYPKNGLYHSGVLRGATARFREHRQGSGYQAVKPTLASSEWRAESALAAVA